MKCKYPVFTDGLYIKGCLSRSDHRFFLYINRYIKPILRILERKEASTAKGNRAIEEYIPRISSKRHPHCLPHKIKSAVQQSISGKDNAPVINPHDGSLILLVDFKADPNVSARLLDTALGPLKPYLSKVKNGRFEKGKVTVVVSGNRPKNHNLYPTEPEQTEHKHKPIFSSPEMDMNAERYLFLDGRMRDLHNQEDSSLVPLISLDWKMIQFRQLVGKGDEFMQQMSETAHSQGKRLRIWGAPNTERTWTNMLRNNVDWLSIDDHARFARFINKRGWSN